MYIVQGMHLTSEFRNVETTQSIKRKTHTMHIVVCALVKPKLQHFCHICSETHIRLNIFKKIPESLLLQQTMNDATFFTNIMRVEMITGCYKSPSFNIHVEILFGMLFQTHSHHFTIHIFRSMIQKRRKNRRKSLKMGMLGANSNIYGIFSCIRNKIGV